MRMTTGDGSCGSSSGATAVAVGSALTTSEPQPQVVIPGYIMTVVGVGIAIIAAVAIIGLLLFQ